MVRFEGTRPQTLSFGLTEFPCRLAAWIVEKFRAWSDCGGDVRERLYPRSNARQHQLLLVPLARWGRRSTPIIFASIGPG